MSGVRRHVCVVATAGVAQVQTCDVRDSRSDGVRSQLEELYGPEYFAGQEYLDYVAERPSSRDISSRLADCSAYAEHLLEASLRDRLCAMASFSRSPGEHFRSVEGIDISTDASSYARNVLDCECARESFSTPLRRRPLMSSVCGTRSSTSSIPIGTLEKASLA